MMATNIIDSIWIRDIVWVFFCRVASLALGVDHHWIIESNEQQWKEVNDT